MTTSIFHDWFQKFICKVEVRPILLLFDGHLTHLSATTLELTLAENISLVKLPAHCTYVLQPLDVLCFSPLKAHYEKFLTEFVHQPGGRQKLTKPALCNLIASIWKKGLPVENMITGFKNTGTFPVGANKYKISRLVKVKSKNYNLWKANDAPVDEDGSPVLTTETESDQATLVNTSDVDSSLLNSAIISSVVDAPSPQGKRSCKKLPFTTESY